jgi:uncharacterized metal-binding protein
MPTLPKKKVGLLSCSGEELPEGTLARMAALKVLEQLRPSHTVTLCLPLFLAGDDKERAFARFYPTIAIDGCDKRCAARATAKYSAAPTASIVIPEFLESRGVGAPRTHRQTELAREHAVDALAQEIARRVDEILGVSHVSADRQAFLATRELPTIATCSCGSGVPVTRLTIAGQSVEVVALPLIFEQAKQANQSPEQIFEAVKVYNAVPAELETAYRAAIQTAYAEFISTGRTV